MKAAIYWKSKRGGSCVQFGNLADRILKNFRQRLKTVAYPSQQDRSFCVGAVEKNIEGLWVWYYDEDFCD